MHGGDEKLATDDEQNIFKQLHYKSSLISFIPSILSLKVVQKSSLERHKH